MFNIMLDPLPTQWNGYQINSDFRIGIQISQVFQDASMDESEKAEIVIELFFAGIVPDTIEEVFGAVEWFLSGWLKDNASNKKTKSKDIDFDVDQWRIYSAFLSQYNINLNSAELHYWEFMGLLTTLQECAFTRVIDIRQKKITAKMSKEEKKAIVEAKKIFDLSQVAETQETDEERRKNEEAIDLFNQLINNT